MTTVMVGDFYQAFLGVGLQSDNEIAVYDYEKCVRSLIKKYGFSRAEAEQELSSIAKSSYAGLNTPVFLKMHSEQRAPAEECPPCCHIWISTTTETSFQTRCANCGAEKGDCR